MVLINDRKFACATCIKGHRVSSCVHTDRPLFEIKKKGRPTTQCQCCKEKRKTDSVHSKCTCGEAKPAVPSLSLSQPEVQPEPTLVADDTATRKGVPGSTPTFPNGLRDVHEMAAAADVLADLGAEGPKQPERQLRNLLNPCLCNSGGICKCCLPKKREPKSSPSSTRGPEISIVTDSLLDMFQTKATTTITPPATSRSHSPAPSSTSHASTSTIRPTTTDNMTYLSPSNMHHPAHTSPHVHKTKLYSPYSTGHNTPKHGRKENKQTEPTRVPKIRPLVDMNTFLGAVFREDGTIASEIPRSAIGLPGIKTFDSMAENGGVKIEPMEMDVDSYLSFPTAEAAVVGACTCGEGCECPGCITHGNGKTLEHTTCGDSCRSCYNCSEHVTFPSGITSVEHLISIAAAKVPSNPHRTRGVYDLDPSDTRVLPPYVSEEAAPSFGLVQLRPLECCNGRCQCPVGQCTCKTECCGCCVRCACDEDGDMVMPQSGDQQKGSCCSTSVPPVRPTISSAPNPITLNTNASATSTSSKSPVRAQPSSSCCSSNGDSPGRQPEMAKTSLSTQPLPTVSQQFSNLSMAAPQPAQPSVKRTPSVSKSSTPQSASGNAARRISVSNQPSALQRSSSSGKSASKALALHVPAHHPHPRPILPKAPSSSGSNRLAPPSGSGSTNRGLSPSGRTTSSSSVPSRVSTPPISQPSLAESNHTSQTLAVPQMPEFSLPDNPPAGSSEPSPVTFDEQQFLTYLNQISGNGATVNDLVANLPRDSGSTQYSDNPVDFSRMLEMFGNNMAYQQPYQPTNDFTAIPSQFPAAPPTSDFTGDLFSNTLSFDQNQFVRTDPNPYLNWDFNPTFDTSVDTTYQNETSGSTIPSAPNGLAEYQPTPPVTSETPSLNPNPNLIDLSKPLNPSDVDRILRALQQQQDQQKSDIHVQSSSNHHQAYQETYPSAPSDTSGVASGYTSSDPSVGLPDPGPESLFTDFVFDTSIDSGDNSVQPVMSGEDLFPNPSELGFASGFPALDSQDAILSWDQMKAWAAEAGH